MTGPLTTRMMSCLHCYTFWRWQWGKSLFVRQQEEEEACAARQSSVRHILWLLCGGKDLHTDGRRGPVGSALRWGSLPMGAEGGSCHSLAQEIDEFESCARPWPSSCDRGTAYHWLLATTTTSHFGGRAHVRVGAEATPAAAAHGGGCAQKADESNPSSTHARAPCTWIPCAVRSPARRTGKVG